MMRPDTILFDCDGVLVDSEPAANMVFSHLLAEHGVIYSPEELARLFVGLNPRGAASRLVELTGVDLTGVIVAQLSGRFMAHVEREGVAPVAGVAALLGRLRERGVAIAACSNSPPAELTLKMRVSGLEGFFGRHIYSADALGAAKPDPAVYLHAALELGADPPRCAVVEDTVTGVRAGVAAGMRVIGFAGGSHASESEHAGPLLDAGATGVARSMDEVAAMLRL
jgi:HAD superfamily hydrolase (TIGR01509 family)